MEGTSIYDDAPCGFHALDPQGRFVGINDTELRWLGYAREEVIGRLGLVDLLASESAARFWRGFPEFCRSGRSEEAEYELRRKDGSVFPALLSTTAVRDEQGGFRSSLSVVIDLSARQQADLHFRQFFALSVDMLCIAGFDGYFKELNEAWPKLLGYTMEELKARPFADFVHPDDRAATLAEAAKLAQGAETVRFENRYVHRDGSLRFLTWSAGVSLPQQLIYAVARDVTERKRIEQQLQRAALHDPLTDLPNRASLMERLGRQLERTWRDPGYRIALLSIDLDGFRLVNEALGYPLGDELLVRVSRRIEGCLRPGDVVARLGDDEFVVVLHDVTEAAVARDVAQRIQQQLGEGFLLRGQAIHQAASIGIALSLRREAAAPAPGAQRPVELLREADAAMCRAKQAGTGVVVLAGE